MKKLEEKTKKQNLIGIIMLTIGVVLISIGVGILLMPDIYSESSDDFSSKQETTRFNGILIYETKNNINDIFNITIPNEFKIDTSNNNIISAKLETNKSSKHKSCILSINEISNYSSSEQLSELMTKYYSVTKPLTIKEINGIKWYYFQYDLFGENDVYLTQTDNKLYIYKYITEKDAEKQICSNYEMTITNSISLK